MHFQVKNPQGKLLTVLSGKIKDIIINLRKQSSTYGKVDVVNLSEKKSTNMDTRRFRSRFYFFKR